MRISLKIEEFSKALNISLVNDVSRDFIEVETSDLNRPGLQFAGFFAHFAPNRVQVCGNAEMYYLQSLNNELLSERMDTFFSYPLPCVLIGRNIKPPQEMIDSSQEYNIPLLRSPLTTTKLTHKIISFLDRKLAPTVTRHGVLMDVYGVGIMLTGESGIGKSETALELVKRGHRLVADDVVEIKRVSDDRLVGSAPELIRHLMEIRGIGIVDVRHMYGIGAVILEKSIDIVMQMEDWDENKAYDRLGTDEDFTTILDVKVPKILMPVRPGRNLAIIVEVAARNYRLKNMGHNTSAELDMRLMEHMAKEE